MVEMVTGEPELLTIVHILVVPEELLKDRGTVVGEQINTVTVADWGMLFALTVVAPYVAVAPVTVFVLFPMVVTVYIPLQDVEDPGAIDGAAREQSNVIGVRLEVIV